MEYSKQYETLKERRNTLDRGGVIKVQQHAETLLHVSN